MLRVTCYVLRVSCYVLHVTCYSLLVLHVTRYMLLVTRYSLRVTCYVLRVTCYVLRVTCYMLHVERRKVDFKNVTMYHRDYSNFNTQAFRDDISIQKWNNNLSNVNDQFNDFYWCLEGYVDRHAPLKKVKMKELKLNSKPWITP